MTSLETQADKLAAPGAADGLRALATLPEWLLAPLQADAVCDSMRQIVPEFASGALMLRSAKIRRMLLKDESQRWVGTYHLIVEDAVSGKREVALRGSLTPPAVGEVAARACDVPFGAEGWHAALPGLRLELELEPPEAALPTLPALTEPEAARALLEAGIRSGACPDMRIESCQVEVLSYKPGSRATIRYELAYPRDLTDRGWPTTVIAKTYRKESKGRNAYDGMVALWGTPLAKGDVVVIAEPLAYIPEQKVMVQGPVAGDRSLEDLLKQTLKAGTAEDDVALHDYMASVARGLAALHQSGVQLGDLVRLDDHYAELYDRSARLYAVAPELRGAVEPLLAQLQALAAATPPGAPVPTHGTFSPEQVMIAGARIGFIDFDECCMAEPALDVGLFRVAIKDIGMNALDRRQSQDPAARQAQLNLLDRIGEWFLAEYERQAPISRQRVALWEAWSYLRDALHFWIKVKPAEPDNAMMMLTHHLRGMGLA